MSSSPPPSSGRARVPGSTPPPRSTPSTTRVAAGSGAAQAGVYGKARVGGTPAPAGPTGPGGPSGPQGPGRPGGPGGQPYRPKRRPRWGRIALVFGLAVVLILALAGFGGWLYYRSINNNVARTDPFSQITGSRPDRLAPGAQNILILGSDSRDPDNKANSGAWRTDTLILLHLTADHKKALLISIPRDTYVYIPKSPVDPSLGDTHAKINAAFAWGGLPLTVETVETFTGVHIDHVMLIDFGGFQQVTDAIGGVDMYVDQTITSIHDPHRTFTKGENHFNGAEALDYIRQRYQFPDGDITRERHQQEFLKALVDKAASGGTLTNVKKLNAFLQAVSKAVVVDKDLSLPNLALQFHNLRSPDLTFLTSPYSGFATIDGESVVKADTAKASALYDAVAKDQVGPYLTVVSPSPSPSKAK